MNAKTQSASPRSLLMFWQLVIVKVRFSLKSEASQSYLSYVWWVLEPLLLMVVYFVVFKILLHRGTDNFVPFLFCGIVPWLWFSKSVSQSGNSITAGKGLISQTYIPKSFFPLVIIGQALVKQFFAFLLMFAFLIWFGYFPNWNWLWLIPLMSTQMLLIIAVSFIVAFIIPFAKDLQYLIDAGLRMVMFGSGIFYSYSDVLVPKHREIFLMNPMANLIVNYRKILMESTAPMLTSLSVISVISILVIFFMVGQMRRHNNTITRLALE